MHDVTVGLTSKDLRTHFSDYIKADDLVSLQNAVMARLNGAPFHMGVTAVAASVEAGGIAVKFVITAPVALNALTVKNALRL
jgi:hypothetical protein